MKKAMLVMGVVAVTAMGATDALAQKPRCTNVPLTVEILTIGPDNTGALDGDAKGRIYSDGVDGCVQHGHQRVFGEQRRNGRPRPHAVRWS